MLLYMAVVAKRPVGGGRRILTAGHAINAVVDDDGGEVEIAAGGMNEMVAADGGGIAIAHDDNDLKLGIGQLDSGGKGERSAVGGMERVEIHVDADPPRTANPGDQDDLVLAVAGAVDGADECPQQDAIAAARAPDMGELFVVAQILVNEFGDFGHSDAFLAVSATSSKAAPGFLQG